MDNVASLVEDAALLLERSPARARSLLILAQEETGKAHRLYTLAETAWTKGLPTVDLSDDFAKLERRHQPKIVASLDFGQELPSFWGDYSALDALSCMSDEEVVEHLTAKQTGYETSARRVDQQKQAGFYVDRSGDEVRSPQGADAGDLLRDLIRTAAVAEMLLITDHSRMKFDSPDRYDPTSDIQMRLLPFSHPDKFLPAGASEPADDD